MNQYEQYSDEYESQDEFYEINFPPTIHRDTVQEAGTEVSTNEVITISEGGRAVTSEMLEGCFVIVAAGTGDENEILISHNGPGSTLWHMQQINAFKSKHPVTNTIMFRLESGTDHWGWKDRQEEYEKYVAKFVDAFRSAEAGAFEVREYAAGQELCVDWTDKEPKIFLQEATESRKYSNY